MRESPPGGMRTPKQRKMSQCDALTARNVLSAHSILRGKGCGDMTEQQAKQIRKMREQGIGYRSIALTVGLSRDIVRNFCKSRGLSGYGPALTKNLQEQVMLGKACLYCGKEIEQPSTGRPKKFCSDKCRREWWKGHPEQVNRKDSALYSAVCSRCGKEFLSYGNKNRKYCSHGCYIKARFWEVEDEDSEVSSSAN
uniref:RNA polymerase subunit sigma-70 n=1 Tax=Agathobacter sp. TaxID=2021311 RepID=UPI00405673B4